MKSLIILFLAIILLSQVQCDAIKLAKKQNVNKFQMNTNSDKAIPIHSFKNTYYYGTFKIGKNKNQGNRPFEIDMSIDITHSYFCLYNDTYSYSSGLSTTSIVDLTKPHEYSYYFKGNVSGYLGKETFNFLNSDVQIDNVFFITKETGISQSEQPGQIGLNNDKSRKNFIEQAYLQGLVDGKMFAFNINDDQSYFYTGEESFPENFTWDLLEKFEGTYPLYWALSFIGTTIGSAKTIKHESDLAVVDFGVDEIFLYEDVYEEFAKQLTAANCQKFGHNFWCSEQFLKVLPDIKFETSHGHPVTISAKDYLLCDSNESVYCMVAVQSTNDFRVTQMYLGNPFFKRYFVAFDKDYGSQSGGRIGILDKTIHQSKIESIIKEKLLKNRL